MDIQVRMETSETWSQSQETKIDQLDVWSPCRRCVERQWIVTCSDTQSVVLWTNSGMTRHQQYEREGRCESDHRSTRHQCPLAGSHHSSHTAEWWRMQPMTGWSSILGRSTRCQKCSLSDPAGIHDWCYDVWATCFLSPQHLCPASWDQEWEKLEVRFPQQYKKRLRN